MEDYNIYKEMTKATEEISKALVGFKIESVSMTKEVDRHVFEEDLFGNVEHLIYDSMIEGGLTLILSNGTIRKRVILGYNDIGEWVEDETLL